MSEGRIASLIAQLILALFLICCGICLWVEDYSKKDEPFAGYANLEDCIRQNWDKRDPEQYCRKIRSKVETARRRKYGICARVCFNAWCDFSLGK